MKNVIACILFFLSVGLSSAEPNDFVLAKDIFRHGTTDRTWKPQAVYVDVDGSILYPVGDALVIGGREPLKKILSLSPRNKEQGKTQLRIYIHPAARWETIHEFVIWIRKQNINAFDFRVAELQEAKKPKK